MNFYYEGGEFMLLQNFISQTSKFIVESGIEILYPIEEASKISYSTDGTQHLHMTLVDVFGEQQTLSENTLLQSIIVFSLLDVYVDGKYPNLEGNTFKYKYENLPSNTDEELILKNVYRIFKTLRNSIVHNVSSATINNGNIHISYNFRNTTFELECDDKSMLYLYTLVYMITNDLASSYREKSYLRTFYSLLSSNIRLLDEISTGLDSLQDNFIFNSLYRLEINLTEDYFELLNGNLVLKNDYLKGKRSQPGSRADVSVNLNNQNYLIPEEALASDSIPLVELQKWIQ